MRISDWSSDVCSTDLLAHFRENLGTGIAAADDQHPLAREGPRVPVVRRMELNASEELPVRIIRNVRRRWPSKAARPHRRNRRWPRLGSSPLQLSDRKSVV